MKKLALIGAALVVWALPAMADDGSVLPAGVLRTYLVPSYNWTTGSYDGSGKYTVYSSGGGKIPAFNLGVAAEYGITDWISAALQWVPGYNIASNVDTNQLSAVSSSKFNANGPLDLFAGAKFEIVGEKSPVPSTAWRFSVAPGIVIPIPGSDAKKQEENLLSNKDVTFDPATHAFGYGARLYLDYLITPQFYIDLYSETIFYSPLNSKVTVSYPSTSTDDYKYGYRETLELEPNYTIPVGDDYSASFGLPIDYVMSPETEKNGSPDGNGAPSSWSLGPNASVFLYKTFIPLEFKAQYQFDITGKNTAALNSFIFQIRAYAKF